MVDYFLSIHSLRFYQPLYFQYFQVKLNQANFENALLKKQNKAYELLTKEIKKRVAKTQKC